MSDEGRKHHIWDLMPILEKRLKMTKGGNWRTNRDNFLARDTQYQSGTMNFALAWYQQAMQVKKIFNIEWCFPIILIIT